MSTFLVFDTETTGLPKSFRSVNKNTLHHWDSCRLVQIAWMIYTDNQLVKKECFLVKPNGFIISDESIEIHGITNQIATEQGQNVEQVLNAFFTDISQYSVHTIVAHNLSFDKNVIASEVYRCNEKLNDSWKIWGKQQFFCTMLAGTKNNQKWPKLSELYKEIIGDIPDNGTLHSADFDTKLCAEIYMKLKNN